MSATTRLSVSLIVLALAAALAPADVRLPAILSDNMVLQQDRPAVIWGWAEPGEKVAVAVGGQTGQAVADAQGRWKVTLPALAASSQPVEMTVAGRNTLTVRNILVGQVWVCSGQSNMEMAVSNSKDAAAEIQGGDLPTIRLFTVAHTNVAQTQEDLREKVRDEARPDSPERPGRRARWLICSPDTIGPFSAIGYFFGREIHKTLKTPVGLINSSWGGTPIESWTPMETYRTDPSVADFLAAIEQNNKGFAQAQEAYPALVAKWGATTQAIVATNPAATQPAKAPGQRRALPPKPPLPVPSAVKYGGMYNGMIAPLTPYAIAGVIWYQGESNAQPRTQYHRQLPAMIRAWRKAWGHEFPFLIVQLANFMAPEADPSKAAGYATVREAQAAALSLPKTGLAVAIDVGDAADIHPKDKQTVGQRLALAALAVAYGKDLVYSGPMFESMAIEGGKVRVSFKHVGGGLVVRGQKLEGFALAGPDGVYHWADAVLDGNTVVLTSPEAPNPAAVRYAWANNPACNLYNKEGLPAVPFRAGEKDPLTQPASAGAETKVPGKADSR